MREVSPGNCLLRGGNGIEFECPAGVASGVIRSSEGVVWLGGTRPVGLPDHADGTRKMAPPAPADDPSEPRPRRGRPPRQAVPEDIPDPD